MLVLASKSSARTTLLAQAGIPFATAPADLDEAGLTAKWRAGFAGLSLAQSLAIAKAQAISATRPDDLVIGADQTLEIDAEYLHKPATKTEALAQLRRLNGRRHQLESAAALVRDKQILWTGRETVVLTMRNNSDAELRACLAHEGKQALASVGAYRLEGYAVRLFDHIEGDYFTVLGLPLLPLLAALRIHAPQLFA